MDRPSLTSARFAAGIVLAGALAAPLVSGVRAPAGIRPVRTVVDGIGLVVRSSALPATGFLASKPGASLQGATAVTQSPYREFSIYAYPFGSAAPAEGIETVEPQQLRSYRASGAGRLLRSLRVPARIFSQQVEGSVRVVDIGLGARDQPTEVVSWLANAGNRLWVIRAAEPLSPNVRTEAAFAAGTSVEANDLATPTSVPISQLLTPGPAMAVAQHVVVEANSSADPPPVRFPPWWSGNCDVNNNPESFPLSSWDGLTACGPGPNRGGADVPVEFFPGAWGELEWECVELSMRWLDLEYGVRPYPANGSGVVANYSRADGGDLEQIANDGSSVPRPGDVLSMEPTSEDGHTAVVTGTNVTNGNGTISILEQNMNGGNGTNTLGVVDNVVEPDYGMPVTEWLQAPASAETGAPAADLVRDGDFNVGSGWRTSKHSWLGVDYGAKLAASPYEGNGFGVTNTSAPGGGIYQDVSFPVARGDNFCASAEVVTAGAHAGARGSMTVWLLGDSASQSSSVAFGSLPGDGRWTPITTCVTATAQHSYLRLQIYDVPRTPTLGIDAVDLHQSFVESGGLNRGGAAGWRTSSHSWFAIEPAGRLASRPYEGNGFGVTNTTQAGGGIYQDVPLAVSAGDSFCADAEVVTAGAGRGARGDMTIWLLGGSASQSSSAAFGSLPGSNRWTQVSTCVTATGSHSDVRIQFYDVPRTPTLGIDAVDLHQSFVENGDFNAASSSGWHRAGSRFAIELAGRIVTRHHTGTGFGVLAPSPVGGRLYQDIALPIRSGESFCADAAVFSAGAEPGARGDLTIFLYGRSRTQSSSVAFGPLPLRNRRTAVAACVTAVGSHSDIRVQLYDAPKSPALGIDAVDVR